ncbi:MAG: ABC transporter permease [Verrucomicrobiota bacterium]
MFSAFAQDLRIGFRVLVKERTFCALAVVVLALGICAVTTMFSVVNGVMIRGFAFPNAGRMTSIQFIDPSQNNFFGVANQIFALDYQEIRASQKSFERVAAYINGSTVNVTYNGTPQRYTGAYITEDFLKILGVAPSIGRDFTSEDNRPGAEKVTLISHKLWQRDFGSNHNIVGTSIRLNGRSATIIGVMPPGFAFPQNEELWIPLFNEFTPRPRNERNAQGNTPIVIGLIRPDVSLEQANLEMTGFAQRLAQDFPETNKSFAIALVQPLLRTFINPVIRGGLYFMLGVCVLLLVLACSNVMNMQFARATLRAKELAIRSSLGATRGRLVCQMLTESLLLASLGAIIGILGAFYATDFLLATVRNATNPIPAYITFDIDRMVLFAVVATTMLAAVLAGVLPAWMASKANPADAMREGGRGNTSRAITLVTRTLVVIQIFVTCIILIASLLQVQVIYRQQEIDYGYDIDRVISARMGLMEGDYPDAAARKRFYDRLLLSLRGSSEIESAALTSRFRMTFSGASRIELEGRSYDEDAQRPFVNFENVTDGYFATLDMKVREGRDFNADDTDAKLPVAVVNAGFAQKYFPGESALGRRFRTVGNNGQLFGPWRTVVGVVSDVRMLGPFNNPAVEEVGFYIPYFATAFGPALPAPTAQQFGTVVVKPRNPHGSAFANALRREVARVDANLPIYFVGTPRENSAAFLGQSRIIAVMCSVFGVAATLLAAVGLYGVMSFSVNQRTQEFGIRLALGASHGRIVQMVLRQGALQFSVGIALGLGVAVAIALIGGQSIRNGLANIISPTDPATYAAVALFLSLVAFLATFLPARRATRVNPIDALRAE